MTQRSDGGLSEAWMASTGTAARGQAAREGPRVRSTVGKRQLEARGRHSLQSRPYRPMDELAKRPATSLMEGNQFEQPQVSQQGIVN
jgi:hypothetical protein